jgi:aryl-alcohol dehydrogenase-like predicted oxidoreductase
MMPNGTRALVFIDAAHLHTNGSSELLFGEFVQGHREEARAFLSKRKGALLI